MKPPIVVYEKSDISVHPSIEHAEDSIEKWDVQDGIYIAYDSEGSLLDLNVRSAIKNHQFLVFKWKTSYERVIIQEHEPKENHSVELKEIMTKYLEHRGIPEAELQEASLADMIGWIAKYMPWKMSQK